MVYYSENMELEVISEIFRGKVNDVVVCRNRLSGADARYTLLVVHDRDCARTMLQVMENSARSGESPYLGCITQNEDLIFLFPYREERKFSSFAKGQALNPRIGEQISVNLVMECLSCGLPWPLLYLILEQDGVQITKDNSIYFTMCTDLSQLDGAKTERNCVSSCANLLLELLTAPEQNGRRKKRKQLQSFDLIYKKTAKNAYAGFPELYQDIKLTALPEEKTSLKNRIKGMWMRNRDRLFRVLLMLCTILVVVALAALITQIIFGEIPWLRLFYNTFDVIGTENLHRGGLT